MKNSSTLMLAISLFILYNCSLSAQNFTVLALDPSGDNGGVHDIKSLSYAIDKLKDSVWFRIETYDQCPAKGDMGYALAFDTDGNTRDGFPWIIEEFHSCHMDFIGADLGLSVIRTNAMDSIVVEAFNGSHTIDNIKADAKEIDGYTLQIAMKLSDINPSGEFNVMARAGSSDIIFKAFQYNIPDRDDNIPDDSYVSISSSTGVREENTPVLHWSVSPEPVAGDASITVELTHTGMVTLDVYDLEGRKIRTLLQEQREAGPLTLPLEEGLLAPGAYILSLQTGAIQSGKRMIVVK